MTTDSKHAKPSKTAQAIAGFKAAINILGNWGCTSEQIQNILAMSKSTYYKNLKAPNKVTLNPDQLERISYLLNIHAALRVIFSNPENLYNFMSMPNQNPYFKGRPPLEMIATGRFAALYETAKRIDALRSAQW